ncbi:MULTISPECIES: dipeptidase [Lysinibacillus]|uniref:Peptidase M20 n=1 Tax=Lysinibacillus fusiformis TaxID=28031 RepID=A0A2I0V6I0_9BACI|nr:MULTISPECIES: dipeptidase [Lysinibacillus]KUF30774.1 peptidase M20 [Lysinibacillus sp. F5]PKU53842.1 peptidase M20 [Lysinibacillus fusiformis]SCY52559.1 Acetylornithine deacetylase/Succinyl-diaminopimelate desuccinylase [Lysinibacillus sp. SG9]SDB22900.1 Acetylornithine deacetylase/Succinyl-diaminopimelate desuccinylase [Lysinibacillus sp. TC-37]SFS71366.1 Acetylornithine deacetylase/Succinyl-diaminopimelate desuccinylase [Lysinibacillus sp. SG55]
MTNLQQLDAYFAEHREAHLNELNEFLRIPSISSLSEHKEDIQQAAQWLANAFEKLNLENISITQTAGHPVVYADWLHAEGKPTILFYGHYDVQPVDPLNLWDSEPFNPTIRDNKLFARGASDDKGQVFMHLKMIEALFATTGTLPVNVKFIYEGEEEIGSPHLPAYVEEHKEKLAADLILISDTGLYGPGKPAVCYGLRGLTGIQIDVRGAKGDLHSGLYGGGVQNAIHALAEILASFRDEHGTIQVEGFYDKVLPLSEEEREAYLALGFDEESVKQEVGVKELFGEQGFSYLERTWARPTLEVNGVFGGFSGEGIKTVLPAEAGAKITCRLVPNQEPDEIVALLKAHVEKHKPTGVEINISEFDKGRPFLTPFDHPFIQAAGRSYEKVYNVPTAYTRGGGSIPIVAAFDEILDLPVVLMGFGLSSENFHAPNEHFHLENFDKGLRVLSDYLYEVSDLQK